LDGHKVNNEGNAKLLNKAKSKSKRAKIFGVDNDSAFYLIESSKDKESVWIISNKHYGIIFLIGCKKKRIQIPMLIYCGTTDGLSLITSQLQQQQKSFWHSSKMH
jgi:hypothetical protein